ncbi:6-hydroxymethylpterin diphosphokinase MptE-like protein [Hyphococcus luteus]|uniref:6-hydroxymethylpterin diphosphokinase MptE-like domain-containing protein n=1 Tax=Hyphococcus luteus TaxID=2058213 RepID=A0A2S7K7Q4_9PROT|nr:6-hydroxymethylpterin diphosphokinase MptE-like protein [Marinicaulis flavus]PQA88547.1 hypothetical protein CW354_09705 [Marinicaulis flavus]
MTKHIGPSAKDFHNLHKGVAAWIVSSGPSIKPLDLSLIANGVGLFVNGAVRLLNETNCASQYFVTSDERFLSSPENQALTSAQLDKDIPRIVRDKCRPIDVYQERLRTLYVYSLGRNGFSTDLANGYFFGCTSTMLAVQFAFWCGCDPVIMLGTDLSYIFENKRFYDEEKPQPVDKMLNVQLWNIANAARVFKKNSRRLLSCSEKSLIRPYVDYMPFEDAIKKYAN